MVIVAWMQISDEKLSSISSAVLCKGSYHAFTAMDWLALFPIYATVHVLSKPVQAGPTANYQYALLCVLV